MPYKIVTFRNPNVTNTYENSTEAGPYCGYEEPIPVPLKKLPSSTTTMSGIPKSPSKIPVPIKKSAADKNTQQHKQYKVNTKSVQDEGDNVEIPSIHKTPSPSELENNTKILFPELKAYLVNGVKLENLTFDHSLLIGKQDEIHNAMMQHEGEFDVIESFIKQKFPELNKCNVKSMDILVTRTYLILCDFLEFSMGYCPKFTDAQKSTVDTDSTSNTDIEFDRQVLPLMNVPQKDIPKKVVSAMHTENKLDRMERHELSPQKNALRSQVRSNLRKQRERMVKTRKESRESVFMK